MDGGNEQRVAIKFCFKAGLSATETLVFCCKRLMGMGLQTDQTFLGGFLNFETDGSWEMTREVVVQNRLQLR
jgi:hypothetical protein